MLFKSFIDALLLTYFDLLLPLIIWQKNDDKEIVKAMATKFSENFALNTLKKHRNFCRRGLTHLDATPIFKKSLRYL